MRLFIFGLLTSLAAFGSIRPGHLELELDSKDYQRLLEARPLDEPQKHALTPVMDMGKRNLDWLRFINDHRTPDKRISFSSAANQPAYPVDKPRVSNPTLIKDEFNQIKTELPDWFRAILFDGASFTNDPPVSDADYITMGRRVDYSYQRAARWILQEPNLKEYAELKVNDVRGYYYFNQDASLKDQIKAWGTLPSATAAKLRNWLVGMCLNTETVAEKDCNEAFDKELQAQHEPTAFYTKYSPAGAKKWNGFFNLDVKRPDAEWITGTNELFKVAFIEPQNMPGVRDFLVNNIEDEWKWNSWQLKLDFRPSGDFPQIVFVPGSTPHVNGLGGNTITMDANQPLTEYNVQWTIRHEYGHVLGFDDCYVEFYDTSIPAMVSYQLDISNLMCSRRGHIKDTHYLELKKIYSK